MMHDTNTAERIVDAIMFKTRLAEITQREIKGLRAELEDLMTSVGMDALTRPTEATATVVMSPLPLTQTQPQEPTTVEVVPAPAPQPRKQFTPFRHNLSLDSADQPGEQWKTFPVLPRYQVSNLGRVKQTTTTLPESGRTMLERILKSRLTGPNNNVRAVSMRTPSGSYTSYSVASLMRQLWGGE